MVKFDVPGAYLNPDMPEEKFVLLKLEYEVVDIMCEVNPEFIKDAQKEVKKKELYLRVLKALYRCIYSALVWYNLYKDTLENGCFVQNPYEKFTANILINGKQCTTQWYVDDNKVTHVSEDMITGVINITKKHFEAFVFSHRKKHTLLGMDI